MSLQNEGEGQIELQVVISSGNVPSEAVQIEEVMNRAHEIHLARGGLIGYDLEDWLQAERELFERNRAEHFQFEKTSRAEPLPWDQERNFHK